MPPLLVLNLQLKLERLAERLGRAEAEIAEMKQLAGDRKRAVKAEKPGAKPAARCRKHTGANHESLRASARLWIAAITLAKLDTADLIREANATRPAGDRLPFRPGKIQRGTYLHTRAMHYVELMRDGPTVRMAPGWSPGRRAREIRAIETWPA